MTLFSLERYRKQLPKFYKEYLQEQLVMVDVFEDFLKSNKDAYERSNKEGHITASGFVLSKDKKSLLMTHHKKLNKWLQLGGHADGHTAADEVAYRECEEESGLTSLSFFSFEGEEQPFIFDLDKHLIPEKRDEKEHFHYDIRYLLICSKEEDIVLSEESLDLKWIPLEKVPLYTQELSILRCVKKIEALLNYTTSGK